MEKFILSTTIEEKDWEPLFMVDWKAFESNPEISILFPGGIDPSHIAANIEVFKRLFGGPQEQKYAILSDAQTGQIVSFISAVVYRGAKGNIDGPLAAPPDPVQFPFVQNTEDREFNQWYFDKLRNAARASEEFHVPHIYIQTVGTHPEWQGQGAASMLMNWISDFAAKEKIGRCLLQASPMAVKVGVYEKVGFRAIGNLTFVNEDRFPGRIGSPLVTMVKDIQFK